MTAPSSVGLTVPAFRTLAENCCTFVSVLWSMAVAMSCRLVGVVLLVVIVNTPLVELYATLGVEAVLLVANTTFLPFHEDRRRWR